MLTQFPRPFQMMSRVKGKVGENPNPDDRPCGADRHLIEARPPGILGNSVSNFQESRLVFGTRGGKTLSLLTIFPSVRAF